MFDPIVTIPQGQLLGSISTGIEGNIIYNFSGIPYAEPPIGNLRFKDPIPAGGWEGIRQATKEASPCPQLTWDKTRYLGIEDCLYVNVYTPKLNVSKLLAVMVYIHGGAFVFGGGNTKYYGADFLVNEDVVVVTFNNRLGALGFLYTDPVNARGDMSFKDQILALKWVRDNIKYFGGDPDNVTLVGTSSGAICVDYHIISPKSRGLFHKVIMESGSSLDPWGLIRNPLNSARRLAKYLGHSSDSRESLFSFINQTDARALVEATEALTDENDVYNVQISLFGPTINKFENYDGFLNEEPIELLRKGKFSRIPVITGFCEKEGASILSYSKKQWQELIEGKFYKFIPTYLNKNASRYQDDLRKLYVPKKNDANRYDYVYDFISDLFFVGGILYSHQKRVEYSNKEYLYMFCYDGNMNTEKKMLPMSIVGAVHVDEISYVGAMRYVDYSKVTKTDLLVKSRMVNMWTTFAKTGNPTPELSDLIKQRWSLTHKNDFSKYLRIDAYDQMCSWSSMILNRRKLWKKIYENN